jgi:hypothetical protein
MVVLPHTGASRHHNCCIDGGTSPEYFGCTLVYQPTECQCCLLALQLYTLGEISNVDVKEESVLRVLKKKTGREMVRDQQDANLSDGGNFFVQTTHRAACQWLTETLRAEVRQGFKKPAGMSDYSFNLINSFI